MMTFGGKRLYIQKVWTQGGFPIEPQFVPTKQTISMIDGLSRTGLVKIAVTLFPSPKAVPALADAERVLRQILRVTGLKYSALVPKVRGCDWAPATKVDETNLVVSVSDTHNRPNPRMSCEQSLAAIREFAQPGEAMMGGVSTRYYPKSVWTEPSTTQRRLAHQAIRSLDLECARENLP